MKQVVQVAETGEKRCREFQRARPPIDTENRCEEFCLRGGVGTEIEYAIPWRVRACTGCATARA